MAQHQNQCSIFANEQRKVSNILLCWCCFLLTASFRCWPTLIKPFTNCFHWAKLPTLFRKFCNNRSVGLSKTKFPQCLDPSFISPKTKVIGQLRLWLEILKIYYYNAVLHEKLNTKIMTSQQSWYLLLCYFNNKINFLFSCEIRSWSLRFRQFDMCKVNTTQSKTFVHSSIVPNKIERNLVQKYWDISEILQFSCMDILFCLTLDTFRLLTAIAAYEICEGY